jgi:hypothetical protein
MLHQISLRAKVAQNQTSLRTGKFVFFGVLFLVQIGFLTLIFFTVYDRMYVCNMLYVHVRIMNYSVRLDNRYVVVPYRAICCMVHNTVIIMRGCVQKHSTVVYFRAYTDTHHCHHARHWYTDTQHCGPIGLIQLQITALKRSTNRVKNKRDKQNPSCYSGV